MSRFILSSCLFAALLTGFSGPVPGVNSALGGALEFCATRTRYGNFENIEEARSFYSFLARQYGDAVVSGGFDQSHAEVSWDITPPSGIFWPGHGYYETEYLN